MSAGGAARSRPASWLPGVVARRTGSARDRDPPQPTGTRRSTAPQYVINEIQVGGLRRDPGWTSTSPARLRGCGRPSADTPSASAGSSAGCARSPVVTGLAEDMHRPVPGRLPAELHTNPDGHAPLGPCTRAPRSATCFGLVPFGPGHARVPRRAGRAWTRPRSTFVTGGLQTTRAFRAALRTTRAGRCTRGCARSSTCLAGAAAAGPGSSCSAGSATFPPSQASTSAEYVPWFHAPTTTRSSGFRIFVGDLPGPPPRRTCVNWRTWPAQPGRWHAPLDPRIHQRAGLRVHPFPGDRHRSANCTWNVRNGDLITRPARAVLRRGALPAWAPAVAVPQRGRACLPAASSPR